MASYLFLTPPGRARGDEQTVVLRDGFSFLAYLLPPVWFLLHRLWFEALFVALLLGLAGLVAETGYLGPAGPFPGIALCLFCGLESGNLRLRHLERKGFRLAAALEARNLAEAEEIFFSKTPLATRTPVNSASKNPAPAALRPTGDHRPVLGLFDLHGGR